MHFLSRDRTRFGPARTRRRRWPWLVALGVAAFLWLLQDPRTLDVRSPVAASDPDFPDYVASLIGAPVTTGESFDVLENGDAIFPAMLDAIASAKRRISFESFIYADGQVSSRFTQAFVAAALRGVEVRIVLDGYGSSDLPAESVRMLEAAGARVVWFNKLRAWSLDRVNYRTHRKVLVVDGSVAFTGGVGLADHWQGDSQDPDHWRDMQIRVRGPAVRALEASFYENWIESGGAEAPRLDPEPAERPDPTPARTLVAWSNFSGGASNVKLLYLLSIAGARRTIDIQSPYVVLDSTLQQALARARSRGVRVRVLTDGEHTDAGPVKAASRADYDTLLAQGVRIAEFAPTMMHVKAMTIDDVWSVVGTANLDNRSLELNDELVVAVQDAGLAGRLHASFERDLGRSTMLDLATWRRRGLWRRAQEQFWSLFAELF
ncbi:cardiolipin synthase B [Luteitalea sp. TBR-22]|uniref:phospholipase D-like domain-containing protein n=1 Tax=Luteitalea sp. TBR-22 TaxID=2802971 RepID=UPI001AFA5A27|nr:phospholipase D-like domain-containing protein [Luteitalea sp. TBR-22]BCS31962.1 cardiolipin synthase B [Luteitalea sp. TBR-22]